MQEYFESIRAEKCWLLALAPVCFYMSKPLWFYRSYNPGLSTLLNFPSPTNQACLRALHKKRHTVTPPKNEPLEMENNGRFIRCLSVGVPFSGSIFVLGGAYRDIPRIINLQHIRLTKLRWTTISGASYQMTFNQWFSFGFEISNDSLMRPTWEFKQHVKDAGVHRPHSLMSLRVRDLEMNHLRCEMIQTMIHLGWREWIRSH